MHYTAVFTRHPESSGAIVRELEARVSWVAAGKLSLNYILRGDTRRLQISRPRPARRADGLWRHTCFEAFVSVKGKAEYWEVNFSPSGEWAAYRFRRYRDRMPPQNEELAPNITVRSESDRLDLNAMIHLRRLPMMPQNGCLSLGLSAVIEEKNGTLSYWALKHPAGRPDFHHPDGFVLEIEAPEVEMIDEPRIETR
jgi:hypothetical protein